ncbi:MAG: phenylalanine--tRNA ligase subunit beta [Actinobacteria bacterium HGW-Actinobacteria-6]|nr:MAG: phenylalanine--tRNA ligase subunit beta [Actinobacteria bacterium HGW-Actinobacteria-6]
MRVSLKWLKDLVDVDLSITDLCDRMDMTGTKVEAVHTLGAALDGVVVGLVLTREKHPDAEKLSYCSVDVGDGEPRNIVCGADNFSAGDKVPVALVGATLPNGLTIKRAKLRGLESQGMLCSATELGVGGDASGLLILSADAPVGESFSAYYGMSDTVLELEVTPNRPDCLSVVGVAREIGAITNKPVKEPRSKPTEADDATGDAVSVTIENPELCSRYTARIIRGVKIGPSPAWLAERVVASGARPINNVVDITNYVMFELGQPLHAFDLSTIAATDDKAAIIVRSAREGETLRTLDGQDRELTAETLVIADPSGPVALAGVMGGESTEVSETTVDILLESASFDRASVSRTSRRLGLISEASIRFERGVDPEIAVRAADRAAELLAEIAGGSVSKGIVDEYPVKARPRRITLRIGRMNDHLGISLVPREVMAILSGLGIYSELAGDDLAVTVPTFRPDIEREVDLHEEVVRVWGMERVPSTLPGGRERVGALTETQARRNRIGVALRAAGLNEHLALAFADPVDMERMSWSLGPDEVPVDLLNPMSGEQSQMRWTLSVGLLKAVSYNQRRGVADVHMYELGTVFWTSPGRKSPKERPMVAGVLAGSWNQAGWNETSVPLDFFDGKGVVETLLDEMDITRWRMRAAVLPWLQPGRAAEIIIGGDVAGWIGEVAPSVLDAYEVTGPVTLFELNVKMLIKASSSEVRYVELPRFPAATLDLALVVDEDVTAERVLDSIRSAGKPLLESVTLFDVYRDAKDAGVRRLPEGKCSLAFSLTYRAADRTLTDEEVKPAHERLVRKVCKAVGAEVRG